MEFRPVFRFIFVYSIASLLFAVPSAAHAATKYWVGGNGDSVGVNANDWSTTNPASCADGAGDAPSVPGASDIAVFDADCDSNATIAANWDVAGIQIDSGYTGTVTQSGSNTLTVGSSNFSQAGGTFSGGTGAITLDGTFTLSGGTLNFGNQTITANTNWTYGGGTLSAGSSTVIFSHAFGATITITGSHSLNNVTFTKTSSQYNTGSITVFSGTTLTVVGTLTFVAPGAEGAGKAVDVNTGTIAAQGNITLADSGNFMGSATLLINGTGDQTFEGNASLSNGGFMSVTINKASGTLLLAGTIVEGAVVSVGSGLPSVTWNYVAGTIDPGTSTVIFSHTFASDVTITGSHSLNNVTFTKGNGTYLNGSITISDGTTLTTIGTLTFDEPGGSNNTVDVNTGIIVAQGDVTIADSGNFAGTAQLQFTGSANQTYTNSSGGTNISGAVTINKSAGTVTLASDLSLSASGQDLTVTSGTLNLATFSLTVNDVLTVNGGTLTHGSGTVTAASFSQSSGTLNGGSGTIDINGTYALSGGTFTSTSGNLQVSSTFTISGAPTFTHNSGTVIFDTSSATITPSSAAFNNVSFTSAAVKTIANSNTLTVVGTLALTDGTVNQTTIPATGTIAAQGAITQASTFDGGSARIEINGTGDQTFTGSATRTVGALPHIEIDKASGTLTLAGTIRTGVNWTWTAGTVDATTNDSTVIFVPFISNTITGSHTLDNVIIDSNSGSSRGMIVAPATTLTVAGILTIDNSSTGAISLTTGTIAAQGNVVIGAGPTAYSGSTILTFSGSATQTFDLSGAEALLDLDVKVNKSGGQVNLASTLTANATNQDLIIEEGVFNLNGNAVTVNGTSGQLDIESGGTLQLFGSETITANASNPELQTGSTVKFTGDGDGAADTYTVTTQFSGTYKNLTIASTDGTTDVFQSGATLTVAETFAIGATSAYNLNGNTLTATGMTLSNDGTLKLQGGETLTNFTNDTNSGTVEYVGTSSYAGLKAGNTYYNLTFNGSGGTWTLDAALTTNNNLTITAGTLDVSASGCSSASCAVSVGGTWSRAGTFTPRTGTLTLTGTSTLADTMSFYNVAINGSGQTTTLGAALTTTNNLTITTGTLDVSASGCSSASCAVSVGGNFSNSGTFTPRTGTVTLAGTDGDNTVTSGGASFYNLIQNGIGGTYTLQDALIATSNITITNGTLVDGGNSITIGGNWSNAGSYTGTGTVTFNAASGTQSLTSGGTGTNQDFQNITKSNGGTLQFVTNAVDIDGTLTIDSGTVVDINAQNLTANTLVNNGTLLADGSETMSITTKDTNSGLVKYDGSGSYTTALAYGNAYYDLEFAGSGAWEPDSAVTVNRNLTITSGTFDIDGQNLTVTGTYSNDGTLRLLGTETLTLTNDTNSGTVEYDNASALNDFPDNLDDTYYNVTFAGSGVVTLTNDLTAGGSLTINNGATLNLNTFSINIAGNTVNNGTLTNTSVSTITLNGTTQTFNPSDMAINAALVLAAGSGTVTLGSNFDITNILTIAAGRTLALGSYIVSLGSNFLTNLGIINEGTGYIAGTSSSLYIADSNFDIDDAISLGSESVYISLTDQDGNLNGGSADTLAGLVVSCATDSEAITLTETGSASEVFRNSGLITALYTGSATNNNGTLTCADGATITATYTDPQDSGDTRSDTANATGDTIPTAPSSFSGAVDSDTEITWSWTDNANNETGFKLYDGSNTLIATIAVANTTSYTETGLTQNTSYTRKIVAYNAAGNSSYSNSDTETTETVASPTPTPTPTPSPTPAADDTNPTSPALVSPSNESLTSNNLPTFTFKKSSVDSGTISSYTLVVGGISFSGIPANGTAASNPASKTHSTDRYTAQYFGEGSTSTNNQTVSVTIKDFGTDALPLSDGTHTWHVTAVASDDATATSGERILYVDATRPRIASLAITNPTLSATLADSRALAQATVLLQRENRFLGVVTSLSALETRTYTLSGTTYSLVFTPREQLQNGSTYKYTVNVTDTAGNEATASDTLEVLSDKQVAEEAVQALDPETSTTEEIVEVLRDTLPESPVNLVTFQEQAVVRRQLQSEHFQEFLDPILAWLFNGSGVVERSLVASMTYIGTFMDAGETYIASWFETIVRIASNIYNTTSTFVVGTFKDMGTSIASINFAAPFQRIASLFTISYHTNIALLNSGIDIYNSIIDRTFGGMAIIADGTTQTLQQFSPIALFQKSYATIARMFEQGRDTRIRQGLANRQTVDELLRRVIDPVRKQSGNIALKIRAIYEILDDRTPTQISNLVMKNLSPTSVTVTWNTNHLTRLGKVNYGTSTSYGKEEFEPSGLRDYHEVVLEDLIPNTTYYFEVMNQNGGYVYDAYYTITTPKEEAGEQQELVPQDAIIRGDAPVPVYASPQPGLDPIEFLLPAARFRALTRVDGWVSLLLPRGHEVWVQREMVDFVSQEGPSATAKDSTVLVP